jgi:NAD(P)H-nitrite reductase large subunit
MLSVGGSRVNKTHIIIGTSAAGIGAFNKLRQLDPAAHIICISQEKELPYNKCFLAEYLGKLKPIDAMYTIKQPLSPSFLLGTTVTQLLPDQRKIHLSDGQTLNYDSLFLGLGTSALRPALPGINAHGVFTFHTLADTTNIINYITQKSAKKAVVIGAGLSGLEVADALLSYGLHVTIVEQKDQFLPTHFSHQASAHLEQAMQAHPVSFMPGTKVEEIQTTNGATSGVILSSGKELQADVVIIAIGARPNLSLVKNAGIGIEGGGIATNEHLQTSVADIYAGGDVCQVYDQLTGSKMLNGTWPDAMLQGMIAAHAMAGQPKAYQGAAVVVSSAFFGLKFAACGPVNSCGAEYEVFEGAGEQGYQKILVKEGRIGGFLLVGPRLTNLAALRRLALTKELVSVETVQKMLI